MELSRPKRIQLLDVECREMFSTMEDLYLVITDAAD